MTATAEPRTRKSKAPAQSEQVLVQQPSEVSRIEYPVAMTVITDLQQKYAGLIIAGVDDKADLGVGAGQDSAGRAENLDPPSTLSKMARFTLHRLAQARRDDGRTAAGHPAQELTEHSP